jgi:hypothetical protein
MSDTTDSTYTEFKETDRRKDNNAHKKTFDMPQAASVNPDSPGFWDAVREVLANNGITLPTFSWSRLIIAAALTIGATIAIAPIAGGLVASIVAYAATMTSSAIVLNLVYILGLLLTTWGAGWVVLKTVGFLVGGRAERILANARDKAAWAMTPNPKPMQRA